MLEALLVSEVKVDVVTYIDAMGGWSRLPRGVQYAIVEGAWGRHSEGWHFLCLEGSAPSDLVRDNPVLVHQGSVEE